MQLANDLEQVKHQLNAGNQRQDEIHMEDFLKHLSNKDLESYVSYKTKEVLSADAKELIGLWRK